MHMISELLGIGKQLVQGGGLPRLFGYVLGTRDQRTKITTITGVAIPGFVTMITKSSGVKDVWHLVTHRTEQGMFFAELSRQFLSSIRDCLVGGVEVLGLFLAAKDVSQPKVPILMRLCENIDAPLFVCIAPKRLETTGIIASLNHILAPNASFSFSSLLRFFFKTRKHFCHSVIVEAKMQIVEE